MKKIGIMTFHASYNCGSILQGMALQTVLKDKMGLNPEIIDFSNEEQRKLYSVFYKKLNLKNIVKNFLCIPGYKLIGKHYEEYEEYIQKQFILSDKSYSKTEELKGVEDRYDALIAGSDQVWNVKCDDSDDAYFLSFAKNIKKIAYAPSLGATNIIQVEDNAKYKDYLMDFDALSVREANGKKWLEQLTARNVEMLLDPSLLLNKNEWEGFMEPYDELPKGDYIFYYAFSYAPENNKVISELSQKLNMPVIIIDSKQWYIKRLSRSKGFQVTQGTGPNAFLNLLKNATYVVTTSFHGAAFSANFKKQFLYIKGEKHNESDDRAACLLTELELMSRYVKIQDISKEKFDESIDYNIVHEKLLTNRQKSMEYLRNNLLEA